MYVCMCVGKCVCRGILCCSPFASSVLYVQKTDINVFVLPSIIPKYFLCFSFCAKKNKNKTKSLQRSTAFFCGTKGTANEKN